MHEQERDRDARGEEDDEHEQGDDDASQLCPTISALPQSLTAVRIQPPML